MFNVVPSFANAALVCLLVAVFGLPATAQGQEKVASSPPTFTSIRVLTYNIHHGRGGDEEVSLARIAEVIKRSRPDVVALQEIDDRTLRTGGVDQTSELARLVGMSGEFVHQIDYEGGRYGQAILSRLPISNLQRHWLPGTPDRERRMAGSVTIDLGPRKLLFVTTHLHHANETFRNLQAEQLNTIFTSADVPKQVVVLAGDLNATPQSETLRILDRRWLSATAGSADSLTFPASNADRQLDYVLCYPKTNVQVVEARAIDETVASDHRPVIVELRFTD